MLAEWNTANAEVITVTQAATGAGPYTYANCVRGDDGTSAPAHSMGVSITHGVSARDFLKGGSDWFNVLNYGADPSGVNDSTAAVNAAITAAGASPYGGTVYIPGIMKTSAPIVVANSAVVLKGAGARASMSGAGIGTNYGTRIRPSASWAQGGARAPAAILFDGGGTQQQVSGLENIWVDGASVPSGTTMHGVSVYGYHTGHTIQGLGVGGLTASAGIGLYYQPSTGGDPVGAHEPQGSTARDAIIQGCAGVGFQGSLGDGTFDSVHVQSCGGPGVKVIVTNAAGGDIRFINCRSDLSTTNTSGIGVGWYIDVTAGSYLGMVNLVNCFTQRNQQDGCYITNAGAAATCPVYISNSVFQGDGVNANAGGGAIGGVHVDGQVAVFLSNTSTHVNTVDVAGGCPNYGIVSTGASSPVVVQWLGGLINAKTGRSDVVTAPTTVDMRIMQYTGGQFNTGTPTNPTLYQSTTAL